jgi:hypothetical protein
VSSSLPLLSGSWRSSLFLEKHPHFILMALTWCLSSCVVVEPSHRMRHLRHCRDVWLFYASLWLQEWRRQSDCL